MKDNTNNNNNDENKNDNMNKNDNSVVNFHVVHERQSRQLCAVHAVNNLLQLSDKEEETTKGCCENSNDASCNNNNDDNERNKKEGVCYSRCILVSSNHQRKDGDDTNQSKSKNTRIFFMKKEGDESITRMAATTEEFDSIADEMTMAEYRLMKEFDTSSSSGSSSDNANANSIEGKEEEEEKNKSQQQVSYLQVLRSNHRTPILGNYSFEVMETCLKRRGVELSWYRSLQEHLKNNDDLFVENELKPKENIDGGGEEEKEAVVEGITIGFIVNLNTDNASDTTFKDSAMWYLRRIPLVGSYCGGGRHWFAITRVRSVVCSGQSDNANDMNNVSATKEGKYTSPWLVVDSESDEIEEIQNDLEIKEYLDEILNDGGNVFRATMTKSSLLVDR